jgi:hypothetical protein
MLSLNVWQGRDAQIVFLGNRSENVVLHCGEIPHCTRSFESCFEDDDGTHARIQTILPASHSTEMPTRQLIQSAEIQSAAIRNVESA